MSGTSNIAGEPLQLNMTHCDGTPDVWWGGHLLTDEANGRQVDAFKVSNPVLSGRFDNQSASFTVNGFFQMNSDSDASQEMELLYGEVTIEFLGQIDEARSDRLLSESEPAWEPTVGFVSETVGGDDDSGAGGRDTIASCVYAILGMVLLAAFY